MEKPFNFLSYKAASESLLGKDKRSYASVKIQIGAEVEHRAAEGVGPVNALEGAMRRALEIHFPGICHTHLSEYWVRISGGEDGTASAVEVFIMFVNGSRQWTSKSVSTDIIEASAMALSKCFEQAIASDAVKTSGDLVPVACS